ncbi:response regulator [Candidatus Halobeggiatoa sp. HSG11]|nr:response regulator [Candidatus Halobeggiatoa sp. HSG11]
MKHNNIILVVDDNVNNIRVVVNSLKIHGFEIATAKNGLVGIKRAEMLQPLLILLDVMMHEIDGFETCRRLKANKITKDIPVIFMTILDKVEDKLKGFEAGGIDYISKPLQEQEVLARVKNHLELKNLNAQLLEQNKKLQKEIQERKQAEATTKIANRLKDEFLSNVSHEIRTPMNAIIGFTQLISSTNLTNEQKDYINIIKSSSHTLLKIINDILDFSSMEANKLKIELIPFSLGEILKNLSRLFKEKTTKKDIIFRIVNKCSSQHFLGDPIRLEQILVNLVGNSIKFTQKGVITVSIEQISENDDEVTLQFSIEDTGIGIDEKVIPYIFESFSQADGSITRQFGGTGLGLAICKKLINIMDGKIWLKSQLGKGTIINFVLTFKICSNQTVFNQTTPPQISKPVVPQRKILLVEDNSINQKLVKLILTKRGFLVDIAENGVEAIKMIEKDSFDIVFMDIQMPEMDGNEATKLIRKNPKYANLPIVAMTAHAMNDDKEKSLEAGMNDYIVKPIDNKQLLAVLNKWT